MQALNHVLLIWAWCCVWVCVARNIVFPSLSGISAQAGYLQKMFVRPDDVDIVTGSEYSGLTTFAHLPYLNCFPESKEMEKYDIAILGAPFDTVR